jgi:hypothetical protein
MQKAGTVPALNASEIEGSPVDSIPAAVFRVPHFVSR